MTNDKCPKCGAKVAEAISLLTDIPIWECGSTRDVRSDTCKDRRSNAITDKQRAGKEIAKLGEPHAMTDLNYTAPCPHCSAPSKRLLHPAWHCGSTETVRSHECKDNQIAQLKDTVKALKGCDMSDSTTGLTVYVSPYMTGNKNAVRIGGHIHVSQETYERMVSAEDDELQEVLKDIGLIDLEPYFSPFKGVL